MADNGDILPSFGGSEVPLACQGGTRRRPDRQAPSEDTAGTLVEPDGSPAQHGGNHDLFTFRRGMDCAVCRQSVRIWCNTCLVCHTCFVKDPRPCGEAVVQVVDDVAEAAQITVKRRQWPVMGIVTQWAIRLQTSDFRLLWTTPPNPQHPSPP